MATARTVPARQNHRHAVVLPTVGQHVGRYTVLGAVGSGAMGTALLGLDARTGRRVALELLKGRTTNRLMDEARALVRFKHDNVIAVHDAGWWSGRVYLAMEYVEGISLANWLHAHPGWRERLDAYLQVAQGLAAAHRAGLVHHAVKPQNVIVGEDGRVRLIELDLARAAGLPEALAATATTSRYASPEQRRGEPADERGDQFSLCVALYEAMFDVHPFENAAAAQAGTIRMPAPSEVPARTRDAILKGLAAKPEDRHASIDALIEALDPDGPRARPVWLVPLLTGLLAAACGVTLALAL